MAASLHDEVVQGLEVVMVPRKHRASFTNRIRQVYRIVGTNHIGVARNRHVVAGFGQQLHEHARSRVVVEIDLHERMIWARSWGDNSRGWP